MLATLARSGAVLVTSFALALAGCDASAPPGGHGDPDGGPLASDGGGAGDDGTRTELDASIDAVPPDAAVPVWMSPWTDLVPGTASLAGGASETAGGVAAAGGAIHLVSGGGIELDATAPSPTPPTVPSPPIDALRPTSLVSDLAAPGAVVIDGAVISSGVDPVRAITAAGDIFVVGSLAGGDLGASRQGLRLTAGGTVYVSATGVIDTAGSVPGQLGGGVEIVAAQRVIVIGRITTAGGGGLGSAAAAGAVSLRATGDVDVTGMIDAHGGDTDADGDVLGGRGGALTIRAGGDLVMVGSALVRGGAAVSTGGGAEGGAAGATLLDASGAIVIGGILDARGGLARSDVAAPTIRGGAAGTLRVGEIAAPSRIGVLASVDVDGGAGAAAGGGGGSVLFNPRTGDLRIAARLEASGGRSAVQPGAGGRIEGYPGPDKSTITTAGVVLSGEVIADGGAMLPGTSGAGADGGLVKLVVVSTDGAMTVASTGVVRVDGGRSSGTGLAGAGGLAYLFTRDGNASIAGHLLARGGDAPDAGGTGGTGGLVYVFTDDNHGGHGPGILVIETDGIIDASGGAGTIGGSGRNDGDDYGVAEFPTVQTDEYSVAQIAVLINSDGVHGGATGWVDNRGMIVTRGAHANASGGDVFFHGTGPDQEGTPVPGKIDDAGDGTGHPGTFGGKHIVIVGPTF